VVLCDMDNLMRVNYTLGHEAGDPRETPDRLVARADQVLYSAKRRRRHEALA
jgi:PleD family two-component response regulator